MPLMARLHFRCALVFMRWLSAAAHRSSSPETSQLHQTVVSFTSGARKMRPRVTDILVPVGQRLSPAVPT